MKRILLSTITLIAFGFSSNAQNVNIPDVNFKAYLVGNTAINTNADTEIQVSEASAFTGEINCSGLGVADLTGIESFTSLTKLSCWGNSLTTIDVSQNTALTFLWLESNSLTTLDITNNTLLTQLKIGQNQFTSIDLTQNTLLDSLNCGQGMLNTLDVGQNSMLTFLNCSSNSISTLDISSNTSLIELYCYNNSLNELNIANGNNTNIASSNFYATGNPDLTCIQVDDVAYSTTNWTNIDATSSFSLDCSSVGIEELSNTPKQLVKITDLIGRETTFKPNTPLIYIYSDGTAEKVFKLEE